MVAAGLEGIRQAMVDVPSVVADLRSLAVHQTARGNDLAPKVLHDALVSEAYTEDRNLAGKMLDHRQRHAGIRRPARTG